MAKEAMVATSFRLIPKQVPRIKGEKRNAAGQTVEYEDDCRVSFDWCRPVAAFRSRTLGMVRRGTPLLFFLAQKALKEERRWWSSNGWANSTRSHTLTPPVLNNAALGHLMVHGPGGGGGGGRGEKAPALKAVLEGPTNEQLLHKSFQPNGKVFGRGSSGDSISFRQRREKVRRKPWLPVTRTTLENPLGSESPRLNRIHSPKNSKERLPPPGPDFDRVGRGVDRKTFVF